MERNDESVPRITFAASLLSKIWLFTSVVLFIAAAGRVIWLALYFDFLALLFALNCLHLATSIAIKINIRARKKGKRAHQLINSSITFSLCTGVLLFFLFASFPTVSRMVFWEDYDRCRSEIMIMVEAIERYRDEKHAPPGELSDVVEEGYLDVLPQFQGRRDYAYAVWESDTGAIFSVACPEPEVFSSRRGIFSKGTKYVEIKYIHGEGLIEEKE